MLKIVKKETGVQETTISKAIKKLADWIETHYFKANKGAIFIAAAFAIAWYFTIKNSTNDEVVLDGLQLDTTIVVDKPFCWETEGADVEEEANVETEEEPVVKKNKTIESAVVSNVKSGIMDLNNLTPYQIYAIVLKGEEAFSAKWYPDGTYMSIGCGFNANPHNKKLLQKVYPSIYNRIFKGDRPNLSAAVTADQAVKMMDMYIQYCVAVDFKNKKNALAKTYKIKEFKSYHLAAFYLKSYNSGTFKLNACCGASRGCGSSNANNRAAHNKRRHIEYLIFKNQLPEATWQKIIDTRKRKFPM